MKKIIVGTDVIVDRPGEIIACEFSGMSSVIGKVAKTREINGSKKYLINAYSYDGTCHEAWVDLDDIKRIFN